MLTNYIKHVNKTIISLILHGCCAQLLLFELRFTSYSALHFTSILSDGLSSVPDCIINNSNGTLFNPSARHLLQDLRSTGIFYDTTACFTFKTECRILNFAFFAPPPPSLSVADRLQFRVCRCGVYRVLREVTSLTTMDRAC